MQFFSACYLGVDEVMNELQEQRPHEIVERGAIDPLHNPNSKLDEAGKVPEMFNKLAENAVRTVTEAAQST